MLASRPLERKVRCDNVPVKCQGKTDERNEGGVGSGGGTQLAEQLLCEPSLLHQCKARQISAEETITSKIWPSLHNQSGRGSSRHDGHVWGYCPSGSGLVGSYTIPVPKQGRDGRRDVECSVSGSGVCGEAGRITHARYLLWGRCGCTG